MENFCRISDAQNLNLPFKSSTFYKWHRTGQFPQIFVKVGRSVFINIKKLQDLFDGQSVPVEVSKSLPISKGGKVSSIKDKKSQEISKIEQVVPEERAGNYTKTTWFKMSQERRDQKKAEWLQAQNDQADYRINTVTRWEVEQAE